jgi:hypothetical protein
MASVLAQVLRLQRAQLQGIIELRGVRKMQKLYAEAQAELRSKLGRLVSERKGQSFTAVNLRLALAQVDDAISFFEQQATRHLNKESRIAGAVAARHTAHAMKVLEKRYTGLTPVLQVEQAAVVRGLYAKIEPSLLNRHRSSMRLYGRPVVEKVKQELSLAILQNETVDEAVERIVGTGGVFENQRWRAERIVRTELSYGYHATRLQAMRETQRTDFPDLRKRLVATFDNRTGEDSKELHGQMKPIDEPFVWRKPDGEIEEYMAPPNRPNDRETIIEWRSGWPASPLFTDEDGPGPVKPEAPRGALTELP